MVWASVWGFGPNRLRHHSGQMGGDSEAIGTAGNCGGKSRLFLVIHRRASDSRTRIAHTQYVCIYMAAVRSQAGSHVRAALRSRILRNSVKRMLQSDTIVLASGYPKRGGGLAMAEDIATSCSRAFASSIGTPKKRERNLREERSTSVDSSRCRISTANVRRAYDRECAIGEIDVASRRCSRSGVKSRTSRSIDATKADA